MPDQRSKKNRFAARIIGSAIIAGSLSCAAHAASPALSATQAMIVHSFDGLGCQDIFSKPREGHMRSGSCVEFQIKIENTHYSKAADAITFKNPVDKNLVFVTVNKEGFIGGKLKAPRKNTDCGAKACVISLENASLKPSQTGILKIRAIVK